MTSDSSSTPRSSHVAYETINGVHVITLRASVRRLEWGALERLGADVLREVSAARRPDCVVDLNEFEMLSSAELALLVRTWKGIRSLGGRCVFAGPQPEVLNVLSVAGLDKLWEITPTRGAATALLQRESIWNRLGPVLVGVAVLGVLAALGGCLWMHLDQSTKLYPRSLVGGGAICGLLGGVTAGIALRGLSRRIGLAAAAASAALAAWGLWVL